MLKGYEKFKQPKNTSHISSQSTHFITQGKLVIQGQNIQSYQELTDLLETIKLENFSHVEMFNCSKFVKKSNGFFINLKE